MSSGFVTESEATEVRRRRQEEWEKVRKPDEPIDRPEEPFDGRSLFDKLKEQKLKKDLEYEETHNLKNLIRGLDDDEVEFLDLVDRTKMNAEKQNLLEEERELREFRTRVATMQEETQDKRIQSELTTTTKSKSNSLITNSRQSQKSLLMGVGIKRKNGETTTDATSCSKMLKNDQNPNSNGNQSNEKETLNNIKQASNILDRGSLKCIAILPGIGPYDDSSDSELSSGSDDEPEGGEGFNLIGVKRVVIKPSTNEE